MGRPNSRAYHAACICQRITSLSDLHNFDSLPDADQTEIRRLIANKPFHETSGDGEVPASWQCQMGEERALHLMSNLAFWDDIPWTELSNVTAMIVDVPPQLVTEVVLARDAVNAAILRAREVVDHVLEERSWKVLTFFDRMMFRSLPKRRGGRRGQGHQSLTSTINERLRWFRLGDWQSLMPPMDTRKRRAHIVRTAQELLDQQVAEVQACVAARDEQHAIARVRGGTDLASPSQVRENLPGVFPLAQLPPVSLHGGADAHPEDVLAVSDAIRDIIAKPKRRRGPGKSGSRLEHWATMATIPTSLTSLAPLAITRIPTIVTTHDDPDDPGDPKRS